MPAAFLPGLVVALAEATGLLALLVLPELGAGVVAVGRAGRVGNPEHRGPAGKRTADWAAGSSWGMAGRHWEGSSPAVHIAVAHNMVAERRAVVRNAVVLVVEFEGVLVGLEAWVATCWSPGWGARC